MFDGIGLRSLLPWEFFFGLEPLRKKPFNSKEWASRKVRFIAKGFKSWKRGEREGMIHTLLVLGAIFSIYELDAEIVASLACLSSLQTI